MFETVGDYFIELNNFSFSFLLGEIIEIKPHGRLQSGIFLKGVYYLDKKFNCFEKSISRFTVAVLSKRHR